MMFWIELGLVLGAMVLVFTSPCWGFRWFEAGERAVGTLAKRLRLAVVVASLAALMVRAALHWQKLH
jgi:hypothetical protein